MASQWQNYDDPGPRHHVLGVSSITRFMALRFAHIFKSWVSRVTIRGAIPEVAGPPETDHYFFLMPIFPK